MKCHFYGTTFTACDGAGQEEAVQQEEQRKQSGGKAGCVKELTKKKPSSSSSSVAPSATSVAWEKTKRSGAFRSGFHP
jgi:hypothetical protein